MTSLTDKMEGLKHKIQKMWEGKNRLTPQERDYNRGVEASIALVKAEEARLTGTTSAPGITIESTYVANKAEAAVVGDWELDV